MVRSDNGTREKQAVHRKTKLLGRNHYVSSITYNLYHLQNYSKQTKKKNHNNASKYRPLAKRMILSNIMYKNNNFCTIYKEKSPKQSFKFGFERKNT